MALGISMVSLHTPEGNRVNSVSWNFDSSGMFFCPSSAAWAAAHKAPRTPITTKSRKHVLLFSPHTLYSKVLSVPARQEMVSPETTPEGACSALGYCKNRGALGLPSLSPPLLCWSRDREPISELPHRTTSRQGSPHACKEADVSEHEQSHSTNPALRVNH